MDIDAQLVIEERGLPAVKRKAILAEYGARMEALKQNFLGYQTNQDVSFPNSLMRFLSLNLVNLGDGYDEGSYRINAKPFERAVVEYYARLWHFQHPAQRRRYWGYTTAMGSTEGNLFALWNARDYLCGEAISPSQPAVKTVLPPVLICSQATHYSVFKACQILRIPVFNEIGPTLGPCPLPGRNWQQRLPVDDTGAVHEKSLEILVRFFIDAHYPIILLLNHGTTFTGGSDATTRILNRLKPILGCNRNNDRRYWIHVDGALGANFSPYLHADPFELAEDPFEFRHPEVMSICASPYKWLGAPWACGIYLMQSRYKIGSSFHPSYIASRDSTISGSRQGLYALFLWERLAALGEFGLRHLALNNANHTEYLSEQLIRLFQQLDPSGRVLKVMPRAPHSNIVCFSSPDVPIITRFSLAQDSWVHQGYRYSMSHVVVLSHVTRSSLDELLCALAAPGAFSERFREASTQEHAPFPGDNA
ncbi:pyridoxal-dependent decarboxylase [Celerinatantimonas sp. YJH-8]|uniref:pyridoxal-dependent decarboxylase n=1 Tax=Celerinatantimonas sp. YJH-8 TaxID=3228714 RepID=UPI0038CAC963